MIHHLLFLAQNVFPTPTSIPQAAADSSLLSTVLRVFFGAAAMIAVLMVTIGGFEYVISQGDPQRTAKAKNTILYAIIGLVVAISGYAIVTYVLERVIS